MTNSSVTFDINKKNWNNDNLFPDIVYLDTNAVIDIMESRRHGEVTERYLIELFKRDGMATWSKHTMDEILQYYHANEYIKIAKQKGLDRWKIAEDRASNRESVSVANTALTKVSSVKTYLEQFGMETTVEESKVNSLTNFIYSSYGVNQQDSKHFAIANLSGINNILTQDSGFLRYPSINIYGASKQIKRNYVSDKDSTPYVDFSDLEKTQNQVKNKRINKGAI